MLAIPTGGWGIALAAGGAFISTEILETETAQRVVGNLADVFIDLGVNPDTAYTAAGNIVGIGVGVGVGFGLAGAARGIATGLSRFEGVGRSGFRPPPNRGFGGPITKTTLRPGALIDRYGGPEGYYAAPAGTPFAQRSLPPGAESRALQTYRVLKPLKVDSGTTATWYGQPGGGTQYHFGNRSIQQLIDAGHLEIVQ